MKTVYDKYYQTENLFGAPYPELVAFFADYPERGRLLDLGCGQGRDAIPLARLGYEVTGVDHSRAGIERMEQAAKLEGLKVAGMVADMYEFDNFRDFDFVLLDSMFHFTKKDKAKEIGFIQRMIQSLRPGAVIVFCIQNTGKKVEILSKAISAGNGLERIFETSLLYEYRDGQAGHSSKTAYRIIAGRKPDMV
ncbi:MAG: class I SAM-dependent methyltransferase [Phaeodactylibacter sp.]|nr:class I SAM-dependent methyltransferase [Phaeodactylibacter sp.]